MELKIFHNLKNRITHIVRLFKLNPTRKKHPRDEPRGNVRDADPFHSHAAREEFILWRRKVEKVGIP